MEFEREILEAEHSLINDKVTQLEEKVRFLNFFSLKSYDISDAMYFMTLVVCIEFSFLNGVSLFFFFLLDKVFFYFQVIFKKQILE